MHLYNVGFLHRTHSIAFAPDMRGSLLRGDSDYFWNRVRMYTVYTVFDTTYYSTFQVWIQPLSQMLFIVFNPVRVCVYRWDGGEAGGGRDHRAHLRLHPRPTVPQPSQGGQERIHSLS